MNPLLNPLTSTQRLALSLGVADKGYAAFDTTANNIYFWDGSAWITSSGGGGTWGSITGVITDQTDLILYLATNYYPLSSNPAGYIDLTDLSAGIGISYDNLTGVITNSAPDQIVGLSTTGVGFSVTGTYPNFTLQNTLPDQTVALTAGAGIGITGTYPNFTITNNSPSSGGTVTSIATSGPITGGTITSTGTIGITQASSTADGYLSSGDWITFNSKLAGTGITNYIPKWDGLGTGFVDSQVYDDGTYVRVGIGGGSMGFPYEKLILEAPQDMKFGAYTSVNSFGLGGASYVLGYTNVTTALGYYPGFEFQMSGTSIDDDNFVRYNFLQRNATGTVVANNTDLFNLYADARVSFKTLIGTGTEMVVADSSGFISRQAIPTQMGDAIYHGTASGTDTYTVTISGPTAYNDGDAYLIRFTNGNTTGSTLNINGLGDIPLYRNNDGPLLGGDVADGGEMLCIYNSTLVRFQVIGISPNSLISYVTNADSVTITKGQVVYAFSGQGDRMTVKLANNSGDATSARTVGLVLSASIGANQKGFIMMQGLLDGLNILPTATYSDGDSLYLGATAGSITKVKPYAPAHLVYIGTVTTASNGSAGRLYVNIQNGYELDELHNVQAQSPALKDTLWYDSGVTPGQWKTASIPTILGYTPIQRSVNVVSTTTAAGSATGTDYVYLVSGTTTVTLPTAVGNTNRYTIKNSGIGVVSIATTSSQTIDGSASPITINVQYVSIDLISNGSNWEII